MPHTVPAPRTAPTLRTLAGPLGMTVTPMSVRTDYQMGTRGHRVIGVLRGATVIDTGWQSTILKATTAYGRALAGLAAGNAARYLETP